jgi:hypothetical protein
MHCFFFVSTSRATILDLTELTVASVACVLAKVARREEDRRTAILEKLGAFPSPSSITEADIQKVKFCNHRFVHGLHTSLVCPAIGNFFDNLRRTEICDRSDFEFTANFCREMSKVFPSELERQKTANLLISAYLGSDLALAGLGLATCRSDAAMQFAVGGRNCLLMNIEYKNELNSGHVNAVNENFGYFIKYYAEFKIEASYSCCPSLLLSIMGPTIFICTAAFTETFTMDPAFQSSLLFLPSDKEMMVTVATALKAVKLCIPELKEYYRGQGDYREGKYFHFPFYRSITLTDASHCTINYLEAIVSGNKPLYSATMVTDGVDHAVIVKFTRSYCIEAHLRLAERNQAPFLYGWHHCCGGWIMLVMDDLREKTNLCTRPLGGDDKHADSLRACVNTLHEGGWVHGDLRSGNVLLSNSTDDVFLIDFDWCGLENEQRYPPFMNHSEIEWPNGASDGLVLKKEHDIHFLNQMIPH